jgi:putative effector of murein hydrolase LrgA (UPF0299 family)
MRHARRLIAIVIGCAAWCMVSATAAFAAMLHDPVPAGSVVVASTGAAVGTPFWDAAAPAVIGVLLVLAVTGLVSALRHSRSPKHSRRSEPGLRA